MTEFKDEIQQVEKAVFDDIDHIRDEYLNKGFYIMESLFSHEFCEFLKDTIDKFEDVVKVSGERMKDKEYRYAKTEMRIWNSSERNSVFEAYNSFGDRISSIIFKKEMKAFNLLSMRNKPLGPNELDQYEGRWHLDSIRDQFKSILFLTKTTNETGPFEFIPGTQKSGFKQKLLVKGKLITLGDLINGTRAYQKITDEYINKILESYPSKPVLVPRGSLAFINTSAIHRAKPCVKSGRYAIFSYYK